MSDKPLNPESTPPVVVAALYHFAPLDDHAALQAPLLKVCTDNAVRGSLLLAAEGINGTIAGARTGIDKVLSHIRTIPGLAELDHKESHAATPPFRRMKVRLKKEIVTMGVAGIDPLQAAGTYVDPHDWNALIADPDTLVIDTRNAYEVELGTFRRAINPQTETFREFPARIANSDLLGAPEQLAGKKIAMFCTGGIRCEKATAFLRQQGHDNVFHLKGGILKYLEEIPAEDSLWEGNCFVFDERVSVGHGLQIGPEILCRACRMPVTPDQRNSPLYEEGVSCLRCYHQRSADDRKRYRARHRQMLRDAAKTAAPEEVR
ncbi:rhodanese-related sulfurtransferase [Pseudohoeflea coraliihabitans]|uniref:tRNA uridine(34) hydroxylase n=1 Tax=Pseudohoeflea coraliihabitans TaxID=2860393 RepID=A0ABS6WKU0_9HYPH|nr:rhodanese-related sulfurtransferase [Pseudohoeflea sp. DP4N28-3]MBW3096395.1 rhodanese-related sulfurtransferase [Pseudohoeflea sp. DP4N28-3]